MKMGILNGVWEEVGVMVEFCVGLMEQGEGRV